MYGSVSSLWYKVSDPTERLGGFQNHLSLGWASHLFDNPSPRSPFCSIFYPPCAPCFLPMLFSLLFSVSYLSGGYRNPPIWHAPLLDPTYSLVDSLSAWKRIGTGNIHKQLQVFNRFCTRKQKLKEIELSIKKKKNTYVVRVFLIWFTVSDGSHPISTWFITIDTFRMSGL